MAHAWSSSTAVLSVVAMTGCGGESTGAVAVARGGDSSRDASLEAQSTPGAGGAGTTGGFAGTAAVGGATSATGGVASTAGGASGNGGSASGSGGAFDVDAAIQAARGISGPSGSCAFTSMACEGGTALCTCMPGRVWDCGGSPDSASIVLPARAPIASASCDFEGITCKGWTVCSPTCTCTAGTWSCVPRSGCVAPSCTGLAHTDGAVCDVPGLSCGGGCSSCLCEPTADGVSRWTCIDLPC